MTTLLGLSPEEIQELIQVKERFRSKQIYHAIYSGIESFDAITDLPLSLRQSLAENFCIFTSKVDTSLDDEGGNCKLRIELSDGLFTECVILSDGTDRKTICISSQVGCKMGCAFCRTADMGFKRNLTAGEILEQYLIGSKIAGKLSNIVFMGMGEPFDNIDNLKKAITILNDKNAIGLGARRMTISTCGVVPGIQALAQSKLEIRLAVSLNSAIEEKRRQIMPITQRYPLSELKSALKAFQQDKNKRFTFEYVLIKDFNMGEEDIKALRHFTSGLSVLVNLIPWNTVEGKPFQTPDRKDINVFCSKLDKLGINYTLRKRKGFGVSGACGQLAYKGRETL
jgi:23S rRNA (adenine2503-C2)-methyltransferase